MLDINNDGIQILLLLIAGVICFFAFRLRDKVYGKGGVQDLRYTPIDGIQIALTREKYIKAGLQPPTPAEIRLQHRKEWEAKNAHLLAQLQSVQPPTQPVYTLEEDVEDTQEEAAPPDIVINTYTRPAPSVPNDDNVKYAQDLHIWKKKVLQDAYHWIIRGDTGSGKTTLVESMIKELCYQDVSTQFLIIEPKRDEDSSEMWKGLDESQLIGLDWNFAEIDETFRKLNDLVQTRSKKAKQAGAKMHKLLVVVDEFNALVLSKKCPNITEFLFNFVYTGRSSNMAFIGIGQSDRVQAWGIQNLGDLVENMLQIYLGEKACKLLDFPPNFKRPAVVKKKQELIMWSTEFCNIYKKFSLDPKRLYRFEQDFIEAPEGLLVSDAEPLTEAHLKVLKWKLTEPSISKREMVRRLYPNSGDGGGGYKDIVDKLLERLEKDGLLTPEKSEV